MLNQLYFMKCSEMVDTIGFAIIYTGRMMTKSINNVLENLDAGITFEQMTVLYFLSRNEEKELIQQDIANLLNKTKSAVLRTINILEKKEYLIRLSLPEDLRKNVIQLTPQGKCVITKIHEKFLELDLRLNNDITEEESDNCKTVLLKLQVKCN